MSKLIEIIKDFFCRHEYVAFDEFCYDHNYAEYDHYDVCLKCGKII